MLKTSPFEVPEAPQRLGARLPRPSEAAVPPSPPREIRPGVFLAADGKMFTQLPMTSISFSPKDVEMLRRDRRGLPSAWLEETLYAKIFERGVPEARRRPRIGDYILAKTGKAVGRVVMVTEVVADLMFSTGGSAGDHDLVWRIANEGVTWEFAS